MINCEKIIDSINVGIITIDTDLNIYYMNKWFAVHSQISYQENMSLHLLDIFKLDEEKLKSLKRHTKAALTLQSPSFFTADSNHYLFPMKHSMTIKSTFEFMQQDVIIVPYDIEKKQVTLLVYDQTTLMEEKIKCTKESLELAKANQVANETIEKLEKAQHKLVKQQDIIYKQAHYDHLTSLANRTLLEERLSILIEEAQTYNQKFGIFFLDLDNFKRVNDSLGHHIGDALLMNIAKILLHETRKNDTVARFGGDEFVILLHDITDITALATIAQKLINAMQKKLSSKEYFLHVTMSIGISIYPDHGDNFNTLLRNADTALYEAKAAGKNTFKIFKT